MADTALAAPAVAEHPAPFSWPIIAELAVILREQLPDGGTVLDPFAGVGRVHHLRDTAPGVHTVGVELEPEWAAAHPDTVVGDALHLPQVTGSIDAVVTSPSYGNRMADLYDGRDGSDRRTYRLSLGRLPTEGSSCGMQWGPEYRAFHAAAWQEAARVLVAGGLLIVNISNHIRGKVEQLVVEWHLATLLELGCTLVEARRVGTRRYTRGTNGQARVEGEVLLVVRTPAVRRLL